MSKVRPLLPASLAAARQVLTECDVRHPRDIQLEAIATKLGAMIVYGPIFTARGSIVRSAKNAVIWVDENAKGQPRADYTGAHELAHHRMHAIVDHFAQCRGEDAAFPKRSREARDENKRARLVETEANHFSAELLMPEQWAAPICAVARPTLDDVHRLIFTFRQSFHASAIRFVEVTKAPCAFVHTVAGRIKRSTETEAFPGTIVQKRAVHPDSVASRLQDARAGADDEPRFVPGEAWGDVGGPGFMEHALALGPELGVMSWVVPVGT